MLIQGCARGCCRAEWVSVFVQGRGDRHEPESQPSGFPPACYVTDKGEPGHPGGEVSGEDDHLVPDAVGVGDESGDLHSVDVLGMQACSGLHRSLRGAQSVTVLSGRPLG